ncbi:MAG: ATP-binding protein [Chloroflexota bacterium]
MRLAQRWQQFRGRPWSGYVFSLCMVSLLTFLFSALQFQTQAAGASMIFLLAVLAIAINFGGGPAVVTSLLAFASLSYLFVEPIGRLPAYNPSDVLVMYTFLVASITTGQLAAMQRQREAEANQREREAVFLHDLSRALLSADLETAAQVLCRRLHQELRLAAVNVTVDAGPFLAADVSLGEQSLLTAPAAIAGPAAAPRGAARLWRSTYGWLTGRADVGQANLGNRLRVGLTSAAGHRLGSIAVARAGGAPALTRADARLLGALGTQLSLLCERERLRRETTETEILRRSDDLKTALLRTVSHDLRTPLASILAAASSLREDVGWTEAEKTEFAETIAIGVARLNAIVENLLDLSRLESGNLQLRKDWYELWVLVDDTLAKLRPSTAQHTVVVNIPDDLPLVALDYVQIVQVLTNLVENAVHYTPPGTEIKVAARVRGGEVEIEVADQGPGVPDVSSDTLFQPFYRGDRQGRRPQGAGLGLAVVKGLVQAHDGRVWAENRPQGGARFVFTLPITQPEGAEPFMVEEVQV